MSVYFIGCLHLGHKNLIEKVRGLTVEEHDGLILENLNKLTKRDKLFILGDLSMENSKCYNSLNELKCVTHVVLGNHDRHQDVKQLTNYVDQVSGCLNYKGAILTHIPIHPMCLEGDRFALNIHAHIHNDLVARSRSSVGGCTVYDHRYFNADAARLKYRPISWEDILSVVRA